MGEEYEEMKRRSGGRKISRGKNRGKAKGGRKSREKRIWERRKTEGEGENQALNCCISSTSNRKVKIEFHANNSQLIYTSAKYLQLRALNPIDYFNWWQ